MRINITSSVFVNNNNLNSVKMENNIQIFRFRTNINCGGCIAAVKPHLDNAAGITHWEVDTNDKEKILSVKSEGITKEQIIETVQKAGYRIEPVNS
jgi:copper chaperone